MFRLQTDYCKRILIPVAFSALVAVSDLSAQEPGLMLTDTVEYTIDDNLGLFDNDEILDITLKFDISYLMRKKPEDEYVDGEIILYLGREDSIRQHIKIRSRGNRRNELCSFPPVRLNFKTEGEEGEEIVKNLKLVTHCNSAKQFEAYVLREYLAYKLYNIITDYSFRVRLLRISYIDTGSRAYHETKYGFIIEPDDMVARRTGSVELDNIVVRSEFVSRYYIDRVALFQYMIGNDDWNLANLHNLKIFEFPENGMMTVCPIPYDFDYSGMVNTHYAVPNPNNDIKSVSERIYLGPCRSENEYRMILDEFMEKRDEFLNVISSCSLLEEKKNRNTVKYLQGFFDEYRRDLILYKLEKTCKTR